MPEGVSNDAKWNSIDETRNRRMEEMDRQVGYGYSEREEWKQI